MDALNCMQKPMKYFPNKTGWLGPYPVSKHRRTDWTEANLSLKQAAQSMFSQEV